MGASGRGRTRPSADAPSRACGGSCPCGIDPSRGKGAGDGAPLARVPVDRGGRCPRLPEEGAYGPGGDAAHFKEEGACGPMAVKAKPFASLRTPPGHSPAFRTFGLCRPGDPPFPVGGPDSQPPLIAELCMNLGDGI